MDTPRAPQGAISAVFENGLRSQTEPMIRAFTNFANARSTRFSLTVQRIPGEREFLDDTPANEMFLDNPLQNFGRTGVIPRAFRINDRDGAAQADPQAVGLCSEDKRLRAYSELELLEPFLQKIPRSEPRFLGAAFRFRLIGAEENMTAVLADPQRFGFPFQFWNHGRGSNTGLARVRLDAQFSGGNKSALNAIDTKERNP